LQARTSIGLQYPTSSPAAFSKHNNKQPRHNTMAPHPNYDDTFALAYGSITLLGGLIGYLKANSFAS